MIRRFLISLILLVIITPLLYKATVAVAVYQLVGSLQQRYAEDLDLRYEWINSNFNGGFSLKNVAVTPFKQKRTYRIKRLHIRTRDALGLIQALYQSYNGELPEQLDFYAESISSEMEGRDPEQLLELEKGAAYMTPFRLYNCTVEERIGRDDLRKMGIRKLAMNLSLSYQVEPQSSELASHAVLDASELGRYDIKTFWKSSSGLERLQHLSGLTLSSFDVEATDAGYFRRLTNYCSDLRQESTDQFVLNSVIQWQQRIRQMGLSPGEGLIVLYRDFLMGGGSLELKAKIPSAAQLRQWPEWRDQDVTSLYQLQLIFNGHRLENAELLVDGAELNAYLHPELLVKPQPPTGAGQASVKQAKPHFWPVGWEELKTRSGYRVRITSHKGRVYEGRLSTINDFHLEILNELVDGTVAYQLKQDQVSKIEVWDRSVAADDASN